MTGPMKNILVVDDEPIMRELVRLTVEGSFVCLEAEDGHQALRIAREQHPDLILLDWMMPELSGVEVAHELRCRPETAEIPIIMLTARGEATDRALGKELAIHAYVVKPFSPRELLHHLEATLG